MSEIDTILETLYTEMSGTGGGVTTGANTQGGTGEQTFTPVRVKKPKKEEKDVEPKLAAGKVKDNYAVSHFGFTPVPHKPNRASKAIDYKQLFEEDPIVENYGKFRTETSKRNAPEQLHKAVKTIKQKIAELDRLLEYTQRLRSEITESSEDFKYMKHTERALEQIQEMIKHTYIKTKKLK